MIVETQIAEYGRALGTVDLREWSVEVLFWDPAYLTPADTIPRDGRVFKIEFLSKTSKCAST